MRLRGHVVFWLLASLAVIPCRAETVTIFAASSMADALGELVRRYDPGAGWKVVASYAASSTLARQIERGAPADLFISADQAWMDYLAKLGRVEAGTRTVLAGNRLVLIAPAGSTVRAVIEPGFPLAGLLGTSRLAMGDPQHVPAGRYAKAALDALGVWRSIEARVAAAENTRAALNYVARGETALGISYQSDVGGGSVRVVAVFPTASHPPIEYPAAVVTGTRHRKVAIELLAFLRSAEAGKTFAHYGFTPAR